VALALALPRFTLATDIAGRIRPWSVKNKGAATSRGIVWLAGVSMPSSVHQPARVMRQSKGQFAPSFLVVVAGETVEMPNDDEVAHNVYSDSAPKRFNLGFYAKGDIRNVVFEIPGVEQVGCSIHASMHATILIVPNRFYATIDPEGTFAIKNVPKGTYTLKVWGENISSPDYQVTVSASGIMEVNLEAKPVRAVEMGKAPGAH
jgi:plastocyanin